MVRVRIKFSSWFVSGYAFIQFSNTAEWNGIWTAHTGIKGMIQMAYVKHIITSLAIHNHSVLMAFNVPTSSAFGISVQNYSLKSFKQKNTHKTTFFKTAEGAKYAETIKNTANTQSEQVTSYSTVEYSNLSVPRMSKI